VVFFGHGLVAAKDMAYLFADGLAQAGYATFAIDMPLHGERAVCLADGDCALQQHCDSAHQCIDRDGQPGSLVSGNSPWEGGPRIPLASGKAFILVDDIVASRDHFLQGIVDLRQGLRLLRSSALDEALHGSALDRNRLQWVGMSLGGIFGAAMAGSTTAINSFALNVPGADLVVTLEDSTVLSPMLAQLLADRGVERESAAFAAFEDLAHLVLDPVDPMNLAPRATAACPPEWREKRLLIQMADTDLVVPNSATRVLSAVTGVEIHEYHPLVSNHAFLLDPTSQEGARARQEIYDFLAAGH
jgi:hypothetical protein